MDTFMDKLAQKFTAQEMIKANAAAETEEMNRLKAQVQEYTECLNRMQQICADLERTAEDARNKVEDAQINTDELREQLMEIWQTVQSKGTEEQESAVSATDLTEQLDGMREVQQAGIEKIQSAQRLQFENIQDAQRAQLDSIQSTQEAQLESLKGLQAMQLENIKTSFEDQLDSIRSMVKAQISGLKTTQEGDLGGLRSAVEQQNSTLDSRLGEMNTNIETQLNNSNEFVHRECVKVYRNVQAVVGEENSKQSENLGYTLNPLRDKIKSVFGISVAALLVSLVSVVLQVLNILNIF